MSIPVFLFTCLSLMESIKIFYTPPALSDQWQLSMLYFGAFFLSNYLEKIGKNSILKLPLTAFTEFETWTEVEKLKIKVIN